MVFYFAERKLQEKASKEKDESEALLKRTDTFVPRSKGNKKIKTL